jgi:uncharacterized repeat protein (TIGR03803 family)
METVLYRFTGGADGGSPETGDLVFDQAGNLYGTTAVGGSSSQGVAYKLTPSPGLWTESVLYSFTGGQDGSYPYSGLISDGHGNWYGTTTRGGAGYGTVYELTLSGSSWEEKTLYIFQGLGDGGYPNGGLILDQSGNLYGTTTYYGTVFKLTPAQGEWTHTVLYTFTGNAGPNGSLTMDTAGNLFGITGQNDPYVDGEVFELTASGGYIDLYDFQAGNDGAFPQGGVVLDASGNIYGTSELGGANGKGTVWEVIP